MRFIFLMVFLLLCGCSKEEKKEKISEKRGSRAGESYVPPAITSVKRAKKTSELVKKREAELKKRYDAESGK